MMPMTKLPPMPSRNRRREKKQGMATGEYRACMTGTGAREHGAGNQWMRETGQKLAGLGPLPEIEALDKKYKPAVDRGPAEKARDVDGKGLREGLIVQGRTRWYVVDNR